MAKLSVSLSLVAWHSGTLKTLQVILFYMGTHAWTHSCMALSIMHKEMGSQYSRPERSNVAGCLSWCGVIQSNFQRLTWSWDFRTITAYHGT